MIPGLRIYGHVAAVPDEVVHAIEACLAGYEITRQADGSVDFVHEGPWRDVEADLAAVLAVIGPTSRGVVDVIDHDAWRMTRYFLEHGRIRAVPIHLDHALDAAYRSETGGRHA